jgi:CRP-like cAMP-binding protein
MAEASSFVRRITTAVLLGHQEREALNSLRAKTITGRAGQDFILYGEPVDYGYVFERGWGCRYRLVEDGRRQILNFVVPGDYVGASGSVIQAADHSVSALTPVELSVFPVASLMDCVERLPRLRAAFEWSTRRDQAMLLERIVDIGRRSAIERMAHLILELRHRLGLVGLADDSGFDFPLTQEMLADALGLTVVHVNRTLRRLRESDAVTIGSGRVRIVNIDDLVRIADFDESYLHHIPLPAKTSNRLTS